MDHDQFLDGPSGHDAFLDAPAPAEPSLLQKTAQALTMPIRGFKGLGVGAELLAEKALGKNSSNTLGAPDPKSIGEIADRAAAATKPGYEPKYGERAGAAVGEMAATAPLMAATGGGNMWAQAAKGALATGTYNAVTQAADRGDVHPAGVVFSTVLGGAIPLIAPTFGVIARAIRGGGEVAGTHGTTLERDAVDELIKDPKLLEQYKGTAEAVGEKVKNIQQALVDQLDEAGAALAKAREKIGIGEPFQDSLARVAQEGFQPADPREIAKRFQVLTADEISPAMVQQARKGAFGEAAKEIVKTAAPGKAGMKIAIKLDPATQLRELYGLRSEVDDLINYPAMSADVPKISSVDQGFLKKMRDGINATIEKVPGGKDLRAADSVYSDARSLYDDFQKQISTQGKAEDVIRRILKGGDVEDMIGKKGEILRMLQDVEKKKGVDLVSPMQKELAARSFNTIKAKSWGGVLPAAAGPRGLANFILGTQRAARVPDALSTGFASPELRALMQSAAANSKRAEGR